MCIATGRALTLAAETVEAAAITPAEDTLGLSHAEALTFALATRIPRPEAQREIADLCTRARHEGIPLPELVRGRYADLATDLPRLGSAPDEARAFAAQAATVPEGTA